MAEPEIILDKELEPTSDIAKSPELEPAVKKPLQRINRLGIGFIILLQLILAFVCVVLINYQTAPHHLRKDLTSNRDYTLSDYSDKFLSSKLIQEYDGTIKIIAFLKPESVHRLRVRNILEEYQRHAPDKIEIEIVDYITEANRFNELSSIYGKTFFEESILIDARTTAELKTPETALKAAAVKGEPVTQLNRIRQFPVSQLYELSTDGSRITTWQDEKLLTSYLLSATEGRSRKFYIIADKSQLDAEGEGSPAWLAFEALLDSQNIRLQHFLISAGKPVPKDAEGLVIIGLNNDFDNNEIKILDQYWSNRTKANLFITVSPTATVPKIRSYLKQNGIAVEKDRVLTVAKGQTDSKARGNFLKGSQITKGFGGSSTQLDGPSRSISIANSDNLAVRNIAVFPILRAAPGWWGETRYDKPNPKFELGKDNGSMDPRAPQAIYLAAAVVRGREDLDSTKNLTSKMIVISNTQFLKPNNMRSELTHFVNSSINWLAGREELVGTIGTKPVQTQKLTIAKAAKSSIDISVLVVIPFLCLLVAFFFWFNRRS